MPAQEELNIWKKNAHTYIYYLAIVDKLYEKEKINKKKKKEIEAKLDFYFIKNHWKLNPFIKENLFLRKVAISFLKRDYFS